MIRSCRVKTLLLEHHRRSFHFLPAAALITAKIPVTESDTSFTYLSTLLDNHLQDLPFTVISFFMAQTLKHGQYIFLYNNIRTNQVIYSLTRALDVSCPHRITQIFLLNHCRIMLLSSKSPTSARKLFLLRFVRTSGSLSQW